MWEKTLHVLLKELSHGSTDILNLIFATNMFYDKYISDSHTSLLHPQFYTPQHDIDKTLCWSCHVSVFLLFVVCLFPDHIF